MKKVTLDDHGQDFLSFEFNPDELIPKIEKANMQGLIWNGQLIMNADELEVGGKVEISKGFNLEINEINYPIIEISEL